MWRLRYVVEPAGNDELVLCWRDYPHMCVREVRRPDQRAPLARLDRCVLVPEPGAPTIRDVIQISHPYQHAGRSGQIVPLEMLGLEAPSRTIVLNQRRFG